MRQSFSSVRPETSEEPALRPRGPAVERIAGWSATHRKTAVIGWLLLVAAVFAGGHMVSATNVPSYDSGQSGRAEQTLSRLNVTFPPAESVLIQSRAPGRTFAGDPELRQASREVVAALRALPRSATDIRSPLSPGGRSLVSADGRSALVTFTIPGNSANMDQAVVPDLNAVGAAQARHPGLLIAEAGDASGDRAIGGLVSADFRKAAATSVLTALALLAVPGHWLPVGQATTEVVLLIGMAVGIDYSLFYLRREREERAKGA